MAALDDQIKQYTTSGSAPARSAALGECAVGITYLHNGIRLMKQGYNNIVFLLLKKELGMNWNLLQ